MTGKNGTGQRAGAPRLAQVLCPQRCPRGTEQPGLQADPSPLSAEMAQRHRAAWLAGLQGIGGLALPCPCPPSPSTRCSVEGTQPDMGCDLKGWQRPHCSRSVAWLVYTSSSPADTISRMATGRWSVRPDSWVIKLNSSTSAFQSGHNPSSACSM